jgi:photosystem II stability/assembly factor-like uncharacterized protein
MKKLLTALALCLLFIQSCQQDNIEDGSGNNNNNQGQKWIQTNGPSGGTVYDITSDGNNSYAATLSGIYRSTDNGTTWIGVRNGMTKYDCRSVVICNSNVFAVSSYGGVYVSANNGDSWTSVNNQGAAKLVVSGSKLYSVGLNGVNVTTNNGTSWSALNNGLGIAASRVSSLAINGDTLVAGTSGYGVFISVNGGTNWAEANNGLTNTGVNAVMISGTTLLAGTRDGAFISTNSGVSWNLLSDIHTATATTDEVFSFFKKATSIYACTNGGGIFVSTNNGATWLTSNSGLVNSCIWALAACGNKLLAATWGDGVFASDNGGNTWASSTEGIAEIGNRLYTSGNNIYVSTMSSQHSNTHFPSIFTSNNNGNNWVPLALPQAINNSVGGIAFSDSYFFMGGYGFGNNGIYRSSDNGVTWIQTGLTSTQVGSIQAAGSTILAGTENGVYLSPDNGDTWSSLTNSGLPAGSPAALAISTTKAIIVSNGRVYRSLDNGASWTSVLPPGAVTTVLIKGNRIFAGTNGNGLYLSDNNGDTWTAATNGLLDSHIATLVADNTNIYTADFVGHVYKSTDNGLNWSNMSDGIVSEYYTLISLAVKDNYLYAGTGFGVWKWAL